MIAELPVLAETRPALLDSPDDVFLAWLAERRQPPHRLKSIRRWVLEKRGESFEAMTDLPKELRPELAAHFSLFSTSVAKHLISSDDTHKLLLKLHDGKHI